MLERILSPFLALLVIVAMIWGTAPAGAQDRRTFVRDAETENTIRAIATPLFRAAGLSPGSVRIYLIQDPSLNAFVAGGQKMFVHTGLLTAAEDVSQVIGVIAHETGHIAGGHLARTGDAMERGSMISLLSTAIGVGAGLLTGRGDVAAATIAGGQQAGLRSFLSYTRTQESAADQAALRYLDETGQSAQGLYNFMKKLEDQELLSAAYQDPYMRTHPLTRDRLEAMENHLGKSPHTSQPPDPQWQAMFQRVRGKLYGFTSDFTRTLREYPVSDTSLEARYARAVAYFRKPELEKALAEIDSLLGDHPDDPYFLELKGQILFGHGRPADALPFYQRAAERLPKSALLLQEVAQVQIALDDPAVLPDAAKNLERSLDLERDSAFSWKLLSIAYGRMDQMGRNALAMGEYALLVGRPDDATYHAGKAAQEFPHGSPEWLQAQDILNAAELMKNKKQDG